MGGSTRTVSTAPRETAGLRQGVTDYLMGNSPAQTAARPAAAMGGQTFGPGGMAQVLARAQQQQSGVQRGGPQPGAFDRINATMPVSMEAATIAPTADTVSLDQMGGAVNPFIQNMMAQLQPMFTQQRNESMAAAREGAGNLTGSGFANILGSAINRSLGQEQATAAQYASQGLMAEMQRQQQTQALAAQQAAAQAQLDQQRHGMQYQTAADLSNANAQRFMQMLMGMSTAGLGPEQVVQSGGVGSMLAPIGMGIGTALGGPAGTAIGGWIGRRAAGG